MKGPPGQKPPGPRDEPTRAARPRAERPRGELRPGEETQHLEGGSLREAVLEAVRAIDAKSGRHPVHTPREDSPRRDDARRPERRRDEPADGLEVVVEGLDVAGPARGALRPRVSLSGPSIGEVRLSLDPAELWASSRSPAELASRALILAEAFRRSTGASRAEAIDYLVRLFAAAPTREAGRAALLDATTAVGIFDIYPLEVIVHALDRYPWFLPTAGFGHVFSGRAARGATLTTDTKTPLVLDVPEHLKVRGFAIVGGARPGYRFEPQPSRDRGPFRYALTLESPGTFDVLVSALGRTGHLVIDRLSIEVTLAPRDRAPERARDPYPPRELAKIAAWPLPGVPEVDVDDLLEPAVARAPEPTLLSHVELIARKAKRGRPEPVIVRTPSIVDDEDATSALDEHEVSGLASVPTADGLDGIDDPSPFDGLDEEAPEGEGASTMVLSDLVVEDGVVRTRGAPPAPPRAPARDDSEPPVDPTRIVSPRDVDPSPRRARSPAPGFAAKPTNEPTVAFFYDALDPHEPTNKTGPAPRAARDDTPPPRGSDPASEARSEAHAERSPPGRFTRPGTGSDPAVRAKPRTPDPRDDTRPPVRRDEPRRDEPRRDEPPKAERGRPPRDLGPAARAPTVTSIGPSPLASPAPARTKEPERTMKLDASRAVRALEPTPTDELGEDTRRLALAEAKARRRASTALEETDEDP